MAEGKDKKPLIVIALTGQMEYSFAQIVKCHEWECFWPVEGSHVFSM
jgi:hypothetical protein